MGPALCTDTVFKENSSGNAWQIMDERPSPGPRARRQAGRLCSARPPPSPAGLGASPETEAALTLALFLTFNAPRAVLETLRTDVAGRQRAQRLPPPPAREPG